MFSFGLSPVISQVFVADFERVFVRWERYRIIAVLILKCLAEQKKYLLRVSNRNPKTRCEIC